LLTNTKNDQYKDALSSIGINDVKVMRKIPDPAASSNKIHNSKPSGQAAMKDLYALKNMTKTDLYLVFML
jgi:hypothetical protein